MNFKYNVNVVIDLEKLKHNILHSIELCKRNSIDLAVVVKSICSDEKIMEIVEASPISVIADSRIENFARFKTAKKRFLIRPTAPNESEELLKYCDISLQSELTAIRSIAEEAEKAGKAHDILLMIDLGDMRDGLFFTDREKILETAGFIHADKNLRLAGIATNYNCLLGYLADEENMNALTEVHKEIEAAGLYDVEDPIISGGASSSIALLDPNSEEKIPEEFNQFRFGEAVMLGRDPADNTFVDGYATDVFTLYTPLIEVQEKPVVNENGETVIMRRGILAVGKQDMQLDHIIPRDSNIRVLGGCSDECVVDLDDAPGYKVGDMLEFDLEYGALMTAFAGSFIHKYYK